MTYHSERGQATVNWRDTATVGQVRGGTSLDYKDGSKLVLYEVVEWDSPSLWYSLGVTYKAQYLTLQPAETPSEGIIYSPPTVRIMGPND